MRQGWAALGLLVVGCVVEDDPDPTPDVITVHELEVTPCAATEDGVPFTERAAGLGIDFVAPLSVDPPEYPLERTMGGGLAAIDITGDDLPDLIFTAVWGDNGVWRNDGAGGFERCLDSGLEGGDATYAVSAVDLDDDGLREVVLLDANTVRLFHNLGDCAFEELDPIHRINDSLQRPMNAAWTDYDGDGLVDVYISVRSVDPFAVGVPRPGRDLLLRGMGGFRFRDVSVELGPAADRSGHAFASAWLDIDGDGDLDHYVANDHGAIATPNRLFLREDDGFRGASREYALDVAINGMGIGIGDVDGDGWDEIAVSDTSSFVVFSTRPTGPAVDVTAAWGLEPRSDEGLASWGMEFADLDHDADLDLLVSWGSKDYARPAFHPTDLWEWDGAFVDRADLLLLAALTAGRTIVPVDLDGDGGLELVSTGLLGSPSIGKRACPEGAWLEVGVRAGAGNPSGLGTLVEIEVDGTTQRRRIGIGSTGVHSAREPVAHFGLGAAESVDVLRLTFPDGTVAELRDQAARRRLRVVYSGLR
jgi:hypothetical protein